MQVLQPFSKLLLAIVVKKPYGLRFIAEEFNKAFFIVCESVTMFS